MVLEPAPVKGNFLDWVSEVTNPYGSMSKKLRLRFKKSTFQKSQKNYGQVSKKLRIFP